MARTGVFQAPDGGSIPPGAENILFRGGLMVGRQALDLEVGVRIPAPEENFY